MAIMHSSEKMKSVVKYIQDQDEAIFLEPLPKMPCRPREITRKDWRRIMKNSGEFTRADIAKKYGLRNVIWIEKRNQVERARKERKRVLSDHKRMSKRQRSEWAVRSERLLVGGFPDDKHPSLRGHFRRDATDPVANDRPHWSTEGGAHLYYTKGKRWHLVEKVAPSILHCPSGYTLSFWATDARIPDDTRWRPLSSQNRNSKPFDE